MAATDKGWIKMFRSLQDNILWQEKPFSRGQAWVDLLLSVNHKDNMILIDGRPKKIKSGQFWTSRDKLAKRWGWSKSKVNRFLVLLTDTHMVSVSGTPSGTLLTIENWAKFQDARTTKRNTDESTLDTSDESTGESQTRMKKNDNKNEKEEVAPLHSEIDDEEEDDGEWLDASELMERMKKHDL